MPNDWRWADVRAEVDVKERYFEQGWPFYAAWQTPKTAGGKFWAKKQSRRIRAIRRKCPEDFDSLARRLETAIETI